MDRKYPSHFLKDPRPLVCVWCSVAFVVIVKFILLVSLQVFVQGSVENEPDAGTRLLRSLDATSIEMTDPKESVNIDFRNIHMDHEYLQKKTNKENINLDGLLRENWMYKHHEQLPSVVVMLCTFCVDWSSSEWIRREAAMYERFMRLKNVLAGRDVKLIVLTVRTGTSTQLDKVVSNDNAIASL
jgi:hypothetical protein